jgi:3-oxoacyl-(acyl-carrier-protein) synthase
VKKNVVVTGIGMITPLGDCPRHVLRRIELGENAFAVPEFSTDALFCPRFSPIADFDSDRIFPENKMLRLMNRDSQLAVAAAHRAMISSGVEADKTYPAEEIGLFGSTGMAGLGVEELTGLIRHAASEEGELDLNRFGRDALKRTRPVLSFKILANMPVCFVSIFENLRGPNAIYSPWEGEGACAIAAGIRAIRRGDVPCALVGGCDAKTHAISFIGLQQNGAFESWRLHGRGNVPGEGAAFLTLEEEDRAWRRSAKIFARIGDYRIRPKRKNDNPSEVFAEILRQVKISRNTTLVSAFGGDGSMDDDEYEACRIANVEPTKIVAPKKCIGDLFAGAAAVQVALAASLVEQASVDTSNPAALAHCSGVGDMEVVFVLEAA